MTRFNEQYPLLFGILETIQLDNGASLADRDNSIAYLENHIAVENLQEAETSAAKLNPEERDTMAYGEDGDQKELIKKYDLNILDLVLQEFFNNL
jgi:hypothetical protein